MTTLKLEKREKEGGRCKAEMGGYTKKGMYKKEGKGRFDGGEEME